MVKLTPGVILGGAATTLAVGTIGYMAWFDCQSTAHITHEGEIYITWRKLRLSETAQSVLP